MTVQEQLDFIESLMNSVKDSIKENLKKHPQENWDGIELRQYIKDKVNEDIQWGKMGRKRLQEYKNTVIVDNM